MINPFYALICGLAIGACDLVPGVSGGTMALILGIYGPLMNSIADLKKRDFKNFKFLILVLTGIVTSLLLLSSYFHSLLQDPEKKIYLYSLFFGLVGGSTWIVAKEISKWGLKTFLILFLGVIIALIVTNLPTMSLELSGTWFYLWLIFSGSMAVFAMLLPGISGSYILMILGPYPIVIEKLAHFSSGLRSGFVDIDCLKILVPLGVGIVCGALFFSQLISYFLRQFKDETLALLLGFMIGASNAIWPFGMQTSLDSTTIFASLVIVAGIFCVLLLESIASSRYKSDSEIKKAL